MGSRQRHARPSTTAALIAVVVLLCQATAWVHAAATPHVTCVEHGESIHLGDGGHLKVPSVSQAQARAPRATVTSAVESAAHGHEHCALAGQRSTPLTARPALAAIARVEPAVPATPRSPEPSSAHVLGLAPKTSPPDAPVA